MSLKPSDFELVIGLEVHCQLATNSKIFCGCPARPIEGVTVGEAEVNLNTCPVCSGQPGALPVLNQKVVEYAIRAGLATDCKINTHSVFSRKNYFYPDLPKGYQISQFDLPICEFGKIDLPGKTIEIQRIHIEEDAGKSVHMEGFSLVNLNRACVPLIEIVSGPEMRTPQEAGDYLRALYAIVTAIGVCDGNLQEGNFRCDANVSVRPKGTDKLGTRTEIKNVNSFKFVEKAIEFEAARQIEVILAGGKIIQETRLYDSDKDVTISMRSKEEAHDYRYFPEPDLIPLKFTEAWVAEIKAKLPELPEQKKARYVREYGLSEYDAGVITAGQSLATFFEGATIATPGGFKNAKAIANLVTGVVARLATEHAMDPAMSKLSPALLGATATLMIENQISNTAAKQVLTDIWSSGEHPDKVVERLGLKQVSDTSALIPAIEKVIAANPAQADEFRAGKEKLLGFFVGLVMKETQGKANPGMLQDLIKSKLLGK
jgi:aspartyl-tRNA(Asn)/glutamyl-tRNA(Gln) amidotransferase subunit B